MAERCQVLSYRSKCTEKEPPTPKQLSLRFNECGQFCPSNIYIVLYKTSRHTVKRKHIRLKDKQFTGAYLSKEHFTDWATLKTVWGLDTLPPVGAGSFYKFNMEEGSDWLQLDSFHTVIGMTWQLPSLDITQCEVLNYVTNWLVCCLWLLDATF